ncbi:MAG: hypothetical protein RML36_03300 [Anaerolineae bacterium]|nr:hypothetical protein [Anaerolineae bacterium]MDW8098495.1 hypothetical protein [Anaerolineae bacterium]
MKRLIPVACLAFVVTLAVTIGQRMSTDAMAVVIGVIFGVAASIPTSLLIIAASRRSAVDRTMADRTNYERYMPPVIVLNPGTQQPNWPFSPSNVPPLTPPAERRFRIIGDDGSLRWLDEAAEEGDETYR